MSEPQGNSRVVPWKEAIAGAERMFNEIAQADGSLVTYQKEAMFALQAVEGSGFLQKCDPTSIRNAVINVASIGLSLNPAKKLAYLVPRDGKAVLDISYMGLLHIATGSGSVVTAKAVIVRANDAFEFNGPFEYPAHKFDPFASREKRGQIVGVYCVAKLHDGSVQVDTMNLERIAEIRARSKAFNRGADKAPSGPWVTDEEEMILKTIIKSASKTWPKNDRITTAATILNEHEGYRAEHLASADDPIKPAIVVVSVEQIAQIVAECERTGVNPQKVASMYGAENLEALPASFFDEAIARLKEKPNRTKRPEGTPAVESGTKAA